MSENLLDDETTMANTEMNPGAETMDNAREVASTAVETATHVPTYTSDEMKLRISSGEDYSKPEIDAMSEEEYSRYRTIGEEYLAANPTPEMKRQKLADRLDAAEKLSKMAQFVVDNDEDGSLAKKHGVSSYTADWLANHGTSFADMSDADAQQVAVGIKSAYDEASRNRGHLQTFADSLKRGHSSLEKMLYQGCSLLFGDGGNTEESRAIQRQTEIDDLSNPQKIGSTSNIRSFGDALDFMLEMNGENFERTALTIGATAFGGAVGGVPGAIILGSLGASVLNAGEAVSDQLDEMDQDENMRYSRGAALGQTGWYSLLDGAFGIIPGMGKVWSKALQMAGKDVSKKAVVEMAKDIASREGLKNFGWNFIKTVGGEAIQEPAQSQIGGRARRYLQTGSAMTKEEQKAREKGESPVWQAILDEAAGGAAAASILGGLGGAVDSAHASRVQRTFDNMFKVLGREELFNKMDPTTRILVSMRVANDALRSTAGVFSDEQKAALEAQSKDIDGYITELSGSGNPSKAAIANSARKYLDILNSQFTKLSTDAASDIAKKEGIASALDRSILQNGEHRNYNDGSSADIYTDKKTGVQIAHVFSADGTKDGWIVANAADRKSPMEPSEFSTEDEAVAYAQKLDLLNQVRDKEAANKKLFIETAFRNMYGKRAPRLRFVDRPNAVKNLEDALPSGAVAGYDPDNNIVRINTDAIRNLGQLYTVLGHERFHEDIAEFLLKEAVGPEGLTDEQKSRLKEEKGRVFGGKNVKGARELYEKNRNAYVTTGGTDAENIAKFGEEMVTERASVADLVRQLRSTQRGAMSELAMKVGRAIGLKMANDLGVSPELITKEDVAEEVRHLWQNGYTGIHAEVQLPTDTAEELPGKDLNNRLSSQKGGEATARPEEAKVETVPEENVEQTESSTVEASKPTEATPVETAQNDNFVDQQTEDYFVDADDLVNDNGFTYIDEDKADGYAKRRPDLVLRPASDGKVKFEKPKDTVEKPQETVSAASVEVNTDDVPSEATKAPEAVSATPVTEDVKTEKKPVEKTEDDALLDEILASDENYSSTEAKKIDEKLPVVKVGDEVTREQIDEGCVNAENIVKDVDKRNLGLKNWVVDRISDDGLTIYLKPGMSDAQKRAAEIKNPLRLSNGRLRESFMGADLYEKAKDVLTDERHTVESLRKMLEDFRTAESRLSDSVTFRKNGTKAAFDKLLVDAEKRLVEIENQNRLNRGHASRERAQVRRGEMTDTEMKEMFRWWRNNDPSAESAWIGAFVDDSGNFRGIGGVPGVKWKKDVSMKPHAEWDGALLDNIPASYIFDVTLNKKGEPTFTGKDTQEARLYSRFLFGMSPDEAARYAIGVREGRNKAGSYEGLLTERIAADLGLSYDTARDLESQYDSSSVVEALLNEYLDIESSWRAHKSGADSLSDRELRERDDYLRNERERMEQADLDAEAEQYLKDYAIAEEEWAKAEAELAKADELNREQIRSDLESGMFKTAPGFALNEILAASGIGTMFKTDPKMTREEEKQYVRSLGPKIYDDPQGEGAEAWGELYRLYRMGEGTKGGIPNWLRHLGVPEGKIDLLADHVWEKVFRSLKPSQRHYDTWHRVSPETIIGNAVVNAVRAWHRGGDALEEKGVSRNVANYDEGVGDDEGDITSKDELTSPDTFEDVDRTSLYQEAHYRRNQQRALMMLSALRNEMSEDRANLILAWQKAHYIAFDRLSDERFSKIQKEVDRLAVSADKSPEAAERYRKALNKLRKVRRDALYNMTCRIAADSLNKPVGIYRHELRELFKDMRTAFGKGGGAYSSDVNKGSDFIRVEGVDVPYTADELVDMMLVDGHVEMAYAVESAEDGIENETIANAWNKEHRNEIAKLAKTDRQKARKLAKDGHNIQTLLGYARRDYGWDDPRKRNGLKGQTNMDLDVAENASAQDVKDFATRQLNMGRSEDRVAKRVASEFGMDEMKAANAVSLANAARKRKPKKDTSQGDLFAGLAGTVEKKQKLSFWDQVKVINDGIVNGKTDDEIVSGMNDTWTMDEPTARQQIGKARERLAKKADKAESVAAAKVAKAEAKAKEAAEQLAKVKTYKVGDVALIPVNETGEAIPAKWDTDEAHRNAYLAVKESIGTDVPMKDVVQTVAESSGLEPLEIGRLYQSMLYDSRAKYVGDIRAMTASGMSDEDVVKAAVRTYGISEKVARRELDSAKLAVAAVLGARKGPDYSFAKGDSLASNEMADKLGPDAIEESNRRYREEQKRIYEDRTFGTLYDYFDKSVVKVIDELRSRGYSDKKIAEMSSRHLAKNGGAGNIGELAGDVVSVGKGSANFLGNLGLSETDAASFARKMADKAMEDANGDVLVGVQKLRSQGYKQDKAEKMVREWGRRHSKPVNLSAAKAKSKDDAAKQALFGDLMSFKTSVTPADDAEYSKVYDRYHNADGTSKPGWLKAPNGKPSNLTEQQWVMVRTPSFKKWFGDWERVCQKLLLGLANAPVVKVGAFIKRDGISVQKTAVNMLENPVVHKTAVGDVVIDKRSAHDSTAHKYSNEKLDAITTIQKDFSNAVYLGSDDDFDGKPITNHYFAYPVVYDGKRNIVFCRAREDVNMNRLYVHEVFLEDELKNTSGALQTAAASSDKDASHTDAPLVAKPRGIALYRSILQSVYGSQASKVVDENGEPLVVYHGTPHGGHNVFNGKKNSSHSANVEGVTFFSSSYKVGESYSTESNTKYSELQSSIVDSAKTYLQNNGVRIEKEHDGYHSYIDDKHIANSTGKTPEESLHKASVSIASAMEKNHDSMVYAVFLNISNPMIANFNGGNWKGERSVDGYYDNSVPQIAKRAKKNGNDGLIVKNVEDAATILGRGIADDYAVFSSSQIKSADPVTYDDAGNVIPLSERFNQENSDIRYKTSGIYTGSAADYEKPSLLKVGTGEGAQVFGWGLYGSERRGVGESYALQDAANKSSGKLPFLRAVNGSGTIRKRDGKELTPDYVEYGKKSYLSDAEYWTEKIASHTSSEKEFLKEAEKYGNGVYEYAKRHVGDYEFKNDMGVPYLYEQTFFTNRAPGDESHLLNWYEPITRDNQARIIRQMKKEGIANPYDNGKGGRMFVAGTVDWRTATNEEVYDNLVTKLGSPKEASEFLARADIDGVKYPIATHGHPWNKDGRKGYNYVSFRDDNITVDHKWVDGVQMFKTDVFVDDLRYVLGARASMEAHGVAVPKEVVRPSKRDAELDVLADMAIKNDVYREKLVNRAFNGEAMNDQEARELFLIARDQMAGIVSQRDGMNALNGKNMAEAEELSNISLERVITAMMRAFSSAGATLRQAQRGASLDEMRDLGVYLISEVRATMAKKGIEGEIPQSVKDLVDKQAKELAAKNEEINAARQKIVELTEKAEKADAARAIAEMKAKVAEPFRMSAEARAKLSKKYGFAVSDSSVEAVNALARLAGIMPKDVMAKGEGQAVTLTDEVRECFGQLLSDADGDFDKALAFVRDSLGSAYDEVFSAYRNEMEAESLMLGTDPAKATVRTKAERQRKGFAKRHPKGRSVQMPLGLTLGGLQDRLDQERRNCRSTMEASADSDERTRSLGRYLRRFVQVRVAEDPSLTNDAILAAVAEEANRMDPDGAFTVQDAARIVSGAKGFDPATKEAINSRLSVLKKAMGLARDGKFTEASKLAGVSIRTEAQMLEDMEKSLANELDRLNRDMADILENPLPDEKESAERVKTLQDEIKETVETLRRMRDERTANEKKDSVLRILSDRHRKLTDALSYEKSRKDWDKSLTPDAERARQMLIPKYEEDNRRIAAELSVLRRDANLMRSLQRQIDEFQRRLEENDFEPSPKKAKPRIESYTEEVRKKIHERDRMRKAFKAARDSYQYRKLSKPVQVWKDILDILGETKALVGSMDLSSMFRQGGQLSWAHPLLFAKNFRKTMQVFASEDRANQIMDEIRARDNAKYYEKAGVEFTDWGINATNADDRFVLNHYRKFTNVKLLKLGIEMSERAFSMYLNLMRADVFDRLAASAANPDLSTWSNDSLKALGNYINVASQRGMIDKQTAIGKAVPFLNNFLWSPRNVISRFQFLKETAKLAMPWTDPYGSKELRGLFAKELLRYFAGVAAAIAFTKTMADLMRGDDEPPEDLELDPRSSNFLTVKIGNTHLDFLSGLKQVIVFSSRAITQKTKSTRAEPLSFAKLATMDPKKMFRDVEDVRDFESVGGRFLRSKLAPATGYLYDTFVKGETFERQDLKWLSLANNKEEKGVLWHTMEQVVPLTFSDLYEQYKLSGLPRTVITGLGTILGVGVQAYDPYTFKQLSGDYRYYKRLYAAENDSAERERLVEYHPMLKRAGAIEAQLKVVSGIKSNIRKREKANLSVDDLKDMLEREQKKAINLMAGFKNPGQVD